MGIIEIILLVIGAVLTFVGYRGLTNIQADLEITNDAVYYKSTALEIRKNEKDLYMTHYGDENVIESPIYN